MTTCRRLQTKTELKCEWVSNICQKHNNAWYVCLTFAKYFCSFCPLKGKNWWMQLEDIPSPLLIVVAAESVPHIIPPSSLPPLFTTSPAVNCLRIQQQPWTIFIPLLCCFSLLSLALPFRLPFCTCFPPSIHSCLPGNYHLHSSSPLIFSSPSARLFPPPPPLELTSILTSPFILPSLSGLSFSSSLRGLLCGPVYTNKQPLSFFPFPSLPLFQPPLFTSLQPSRP